MSEKDLTPVPAKDTDDTSQDVTIRDHIGGIEPKKRSAKSRGVLPFLKDLKPMHAKFVKEYIKSGGNQTQAYYNAYPNARLSTAGSNGHKLLKRADVREAVLQAMKIAGADEWTVSQRISDFLVSKDPWTVDRGITHSRAILGLDAPSESKVQIDKRSVNITLTAEESKQLLSTLIKNSK